MQSRGLFVGLALFVLAAQTAFSQALSIQASAPSQVALVAAPVVGAQDYSDSERLARLSSIAGELQDRKSDAVALTTEAARLCGFAIWKEDRTKVADPTGSPALHLAVTDTEIEEYTSMFRTGHSVALSDMIGAIDVLGKSIGVKRSCEPFVMGWLQSGDRSDNASVRALVCFLQDLGSLRSGGAAGVFANGNVRLDPIQSLFILRVLTEDIGVPVRRALAKHKPSTLLASTSPIPEPKVELAGWAEDLYTGVIVEHYESVVEAMELGEEATATYMEQVGRANAIASLAKFVATYTYLKGDIGVEGRGQPLVRNWDGDEGEERTVVAHFYIDAPRAMNWLKEHRILLAQFLGLDLDMPKSGDLADVRTEWDLDESPNPALQIIYTSREQDERFKDPYKVYTDEKGKARVNYVGAKREPPLVKTKIMPEDKVVWLHVTPQAKAVEMKQDIVDALLGAVGIKGGPTGFVTVLMETLYRMNWTGTVTYPIHVRDWQEAETFGQLSIDLQASGHDIKRGSAMHLSLNRSLSFTDTAMTVYGGEAPILDRKKFEKMPAAFREEMEESFKQMEAQSKKRQFDAKGPGTVSMSIDDALTQEGDIVECGPATHYANITTWTASQTAAYDPRQWPVTPLQFRVDVDLNTKTATLRAQCALRALKFMTATGGKVTKNSKEQVPMEMFTGLELEAPFNRGKDIVLPLKETEVVGGGARNFYGTVPIHFGFGPSGKFKGTAFVGFSVTLKAVKKAGSGTGSGKSKSKGKG